MSVKDFTAHRQLRKKAESQLQQISTGSEPVDTFAKLLHELRVHQVELEMQNDELRSAQVELAKMRDRYVDLFEFAPIAYITLTASGEIANINQTGASLLQADRRRLRGLLLEKFVMADDQAIWRRFWNHPREHGRQQTCELTILRRDGTYFFGSLCACLVSGVDGLENTYRCPASLCAISSRFVQKNPQQIRKTVRSACPDVANPIRVIRVDHEEQIHSAIAMRIAEITSNSSGGKRRPTLFVIGRYNKEREFLPLQFDESKIAVEFMTAHSAKGLEADHVILPRMTSETLGFPSRIADDPVLGLAMPGEDAFQDAEERRLFYVALTRAKSTVTLITLTHKESPFVAELIKDNQLEAVTLDGEQTNAAVCPACGEGFLDRRNGKYGVFLGCSRFPRCRHTERFLH